MKKTSFYAFAAALTMAFVGLTSCGQIEDNPVAPEPVFEPSADAVAFMNYSTAEEYPYYRLGEPEGSSFNVINNTLVIENTVEQANNWDLQPMILDWFNVKEGYNYTVRITYKSTVESVVWLTFGTWNNGGTANYNVPIEKTDEYKTLDVNFEKVEFSTEGHDAHALFQMGKTIGTVSIKMVELFEVAP